MTHNNIASGLRRGVFINTSRAVCSIHESGVHVFRSISQCSEYSLDYYSMDVIDIDALRSEKRVKLKNADSECNFPLEAYDFWVFNWHFYTMAMDIDPSVIAALPGPKFTVVLELAPGDPLRLVPPNVFDACIALDPDAVQTDTIYPFPRPLSAEPRQPKAKIREVPVIGSFGFATPGKGFEAIVQAANLEFDRAIVRINIPAGDYIGTDFLHGRDYAAHLEDLCTRIAKPGIEVRFTRLLMSPEELIDWCGENDLNCFFYTRCQTGLAATTDQAILSGRPLLTSSNDTFRHVLRYIDPYPLTTLRQAIETTALKVKRIQQDWSMSAFTAQFARMLADFGVLSGDTLDDPPSAIQRTRRTVLLASADPVSEDVLARPRRLANALGRTGTYSVSYVQCRDAPAVAAAVRSNNPDAIIITEIPGCDSAQLDAALSGVDVPMLHLTQTATVPEGSVLRKGRVLEAGVIPVAPYFTISQGLADYDTVWLVGFTADLPALRKMLQRVSREVPGARVRVQLLPNASRRSIEALEAVFEAVPRVWAEAEAAVEEGERAIYSFAAARLILVKNVVGYSDFLQNQAELAMVTERAVAFSKEAPFAPFASTAVQFEDHDLSDLIERANGVQAGVVQQVSEGAAFASLHKVLTNSFEPAVVDNSNSPSDQEREQNVSVPEGDKVIENVLPSASLAPSNAASASQGLNPPEQVPDEWNGRSDDLRFIEDAFRRYLGREPDGAGKRHYMDQLASGMSRQRIIKGIRNSKEAKLFKLRRGGEVIASVQDLMRLDGAAFVARAYQTILGRPADPSGLAHHVNLLKLGHSKAAIIAGLYNSPERDPAILELLGLVEFVNEHERSQGSVLRRLLRLGQRKRDARALNLAEYRLSVLETVLANERAQYAKALEQMYQQTVRLESAVALAQMEAEGLYGDGFTPPVSTRNAKLVHAQHKPGTWHILIGQSGHPFVEVSPYLVEFVRAALGEGRPVRLVEWDYMHKQIVFASRETLRSQIWAGLVGLELEEHPPRGFGSVVLDKSSISMQDWLLICDTFRQPEDSAILSEVDLIIESRRIGLENAFIFHGAGPLARADSTREDVDCQEQYMQALLLADGVVATSTLALEELEHFYSVSQKADFSSPRRLVLAPDGGPVSWTDHQRELTVALEAIRSQAPYIACTIVNADAVQYANASIPTSRDLSSGLKRLGVVVAEVNHSKLPLQLAGVTKGSPIDEGATDVTQWLIVSGMPDTMELEKIVDVARECGFRIALVMSEPLSRATVDMPSFATVLTGFDKIVCGDEAIAESVWHALLSCRDRFPCCDDRIAVILKPASSSDSHLDDYCCKLANVLARDVPRKRVMTLSARDASKAQALMPRLIKRPKLSLCISTYNRSKWLDLSLKNIFEQVQRERDDLEILVVDNCSEDETPYILKKYQVRRDFRFIRNPKNVGMLGNLAVTSQFARGEYVWILGDDDLTRAGSIERVLKLIHENKDIELIYMNYGYTTEGNPDNIGNIKDFLDGYNVLQPACVDEMSTVAKLAAKTENFYTAIYSHIYRRDHAMRSYCQDTSGRIFATMRACIPTTYYVLHYMAQCSAYWLGEPQIVVNSNVSWASYGPMLELEHLPGAWDLAERAGCPVDQVDMRRANRLWLVETMWRNLFEDDAVGNASYVSPARTVMRLRHLPEFESHLPEFKRIYSAAHETGHPAASLSPSVLFGAF